MGVTKNEISKGQTLQFLKKHCPSFLAKLCLIHDKSNKAFMIYEFFFYFFLLKTNGKIHCKERHQRERAEAGGRQTQVN